VDAAFARLSTSLGFRDSRQYTLLDEFPSIAPPDDLERMLARAIRLRPELMSIRSELQAAVKFIDATRALRYPTISAYAAAGVVPHGDDRLPQQYGAIGVNLSVPILEGGKISALQRQAVLRELAMEERLTETENNIARNVRVALLNAKAAFENIAISSRLRDGAAQALSLAEARYNLGITSIVELNQAQLAAIGGELAQSRAKFDYLISRAVLEYQLGTIDASGGHYNRVDQ
jgi:outer membrane protein